MTTPNLAEGLLATLQQLGTGSVHEVLQHIVDLAVVSVPGCQHAGVTLVHGRKVVTPAASDAVALRLDAVQSETGQGPCLDALRDENVVSSDDLSTDVRWPLFAARGHAETGVVSLIGLRLFARERTLGALNLMSDEAGAFGEDSLAAAALFAGVAAVVLGAAQKEEDLQVALTSRDVIGQAKGILMQRYRIAQDEAFQRLSTASQNLNLRLVEVAERVVYTGEVPTADARRFVGSVAEGPAGTWACRQDTRTEVPRAPLESPCEARAASPPSCFDPRPPRLLTDLLDGGPGQGLPSCLAQAAC